MGIMVDIVGAKEKICTFCLWSETRKSPWIFKPCNV